MRYFKAQEIFPEEIIKLLQNYVDGECIYIPRKESNKKAWGEVSNSKNEIKIRNENIYSDFKAGISKELLSRKYFLSEKSIERIALQEKRKLIFYEDV